MRPGVTGSLIEPDAPPARFAEALITLVDDPDLAVGSPRRRRRSRSSSPGVRSWRRSGGGIIVRSRRRGRTPRGPWSRVLRAGPTTIDEAGDSRVLAHGRVASSTTEVTPIQ